MTSKYNSILCLLFCFCSTMLLAQSVDEMARMSDIRNGATARVLGVGGAFTSLGADFSSNALNPAGIGMYRSSEYTIGFDYQNTGSKADYLGTSNNSTLNRFKINEFGMVISRPRRKEGKLKSINYAMGLNQGANFHRDRFYSAFNREHSVSDLFLELAQGQTVSEINSSGTSLESLALNSGIIQQDPTNPNSYITALNETSDSTGTDLGVLQTETITNRKSYTNIDFTISANYNNKLFIGASLGLPSYNHELIYDYFENDSEGNIPQFRELNYFYSESVEAVGVNLTLGAVYLLTNNIRVGGSIKSPTSIALLNEINLAFISVLEDITAQGSVDEFPAGFSNSIQYTAASPARLNLGVSYLNQKGFLSADVELIPHGSGRYAFLDDDIQNLPGLAEFETELNDRVGNSLQTTANFRLGGEYVMNKMRYRAGYAFQASPYASGEINGKSTFSAGLGYRVRVGFIDFAALYSQYSESYLPYELEQQSVSAVDINNRAINLVLTTGVKF